MTTTKTSTKTTKKASTATKTAKKVCPRCNRVVRAQDIYCPACGQKIDGVTIEKVIDRVGDVLDPNPDVKSRLVAAVLAFFFGALGIHNFYLGFQNRALTQLLVSTIGGLCTCGLATIAMQIWAFVEMILILTNSQGYTCDAKGVPLRD
ncbi:TM2 domain-containing protein [bacterium]|nr:TM2 domain-containing protein [bacterium]MBQ6436454.1 TM2 domain-containing protein [bacterium]